MWNQKNFLCAACPNNRQFPSFQTFKDIRAHSLQVHGVHLEAAVQSATVLPDSLAMYLCLLCAPDKREVFISETSVKQHLESHSSFFLRNWNDFVEIQCRICEFVIPLKVLNEHVKEHHPSNLFANIDSVNKNMEEGPEGSKSPSMLETSPRIKTCQASQQVSKDAKLLWDDCFKPDKLISKYFTKLLPSKIEQQKLSSPKNTKPCIRIKPLSLLQAQTEQSVSPPQTASSRSPLSYTQPTAPASSSSSLCGNHERSLSFVAPKRRYTSRSSSVDRTLPPSRTWWSKKPSTNFETKADCFVCGIQMARNKLCFHIQDHHRDMLFRCRMEPCNMKKEDFFKKSTFLFPGQLGRHQRDYHKLDKNTLLDLSTNMTGLPASLVKISCSECPKFILNSDVGILIKHVESEHRGIRACLLYNCRVCSKPFSSMEEVVKHGKTHRSKNQSKTEMIYKEWCQTIRHRSRGRRFTPRRSPSSSNSSLSSHDKYLSERPRNRSRSSSRAHTYNQTKTGRWKSPMNARWRSERSSSRVHSDISRSSSRNLSRRSCSRKTRRPSRSRSRSMASSVRNKSVTKRLSRSKSRKFKSPSRSSYSSWKRCSSRTSKYLKSDRQTRSRGRESRSRSPRRSSRSHSRLRGRKSSSSSTTYFSYRARYPAEKEY